MMAPITDTLMRLRDDVADSLDRLSGRLRGQRDNYFDEEPIYGRRDSADSLLGGLLGGFGESTLAPRQGVHSGRGTQVRAHSGESIRSSADVRVHVDNRSDEVVLRAEVPGYSKDEIDVDLFEDRVVLRGRTESSKEDRNDNASVRTHQSKSFYRSITLPAEVKSDETSAEYRDGILTVTMPKTNTSKGHKVTIRTA